MIRFVGYEIDYALAGQIAVGWIIVSVIATPLIGRLLHNLRTKREFEGHLARSGECARLEKLVQLADEYDAAPTDRERQRVFRKAQLLGLAPEADEPFHLDEPSQPRPAA